MNNNNLTKQPILVLGAKSTPSAEIPNFFEKNSNKLIDLLTNPPYLRYTGWNLLTLGQPEIKNGEYWEIKNGDRKTLRLYNDGTFVASCYADNTFLGWGRETKEFEEHPLINSIALAEYIYEFVNLYSHFLEYMNIRKKVTFSFNLYNTKTAAGNSLLLSKYEVKNFLYSFNEGTHPIESDGNIKGNFDVEIDNQQINSSREAFKLLAKLYLFANIPLDEIPYTKQENSERVIDVQKIVGQG